MTCDAELTIPGTEETAEEERARLFEATRSELEDNLERADKALTNAMDKRAKAANALRGFERGCALAGIPLANSDEALDRDED